MNKRSIVRKILEKGLVLMLMERRERRGGGDQLGVKTVGERNQEPENLQFNAMTHQN